MSEAAAPKGKVNWLVKLFVCFHALMVLIWCFPPTSEDIAKRVSEGKKYPTDLLIFYSNGYLKDTRRPWTRYMSSTGLWQYWDMFSPNPAQVDFWIDANVVYQNGTEKIYSYPRMADLPIFQKYIKERYRKYTERSTSDDPASRRHYPSFAQRIAFEAATDKSNLPVEVQLRRHWKRILPPDQVTPEQYTTVNYFTYLVDQRQLKEDKGW